MKEARKRRKLNNARNMLPWVLSQSVLGRASETGWAGVGEQVGVGASCDENEHGDKGNENAHAGI